MTTTSSGQCDPEWLGQRLLDQPLDPGSEGAALDPHPILVDCRPATNYGTVHIVGAVSLSLPTLIQRRLLKGNLAMPAALGYCSCDDRGSKVSEGRWRSNLIVLYDDDMTSVTPDVTSEGDVTNGNVTSRIVSVLLRQLKKDGYSVCFLLGGLQQFRAKYPHLCTNRSGDDNDVTSGLQKGLRNLRLQSTPATPEVQPEETTTSSSSDRKTVPVEVLPHLFLGDAGNASDLECLEGKGIRYIINVTPNVPNAFETKEEFKYLQIPIKDHWSQNLTNYFPQAITFIDEGLGLNYGVLVHCLAGISRSVTVTVAYLMYSMSLSLNDAYDFVKQRKPNVSPNLTFMGQLLDFENALKVDRKRCHHPHPHPYDPSSASSSSPSSSSSFCSYCSSTTTSSSSSSSSSSSCAMVSPPGGETGSCRQEVRIVTSDSCSVPSTTKVTEVSSSSLSNDCNHSTVYCNR